jgi:putative transposase
VRAAYATLKVSQCHVVRFSERRTVEVGNDEELGPLTVGVQVSRGLYPHIAPQSDRRRAQDNARRDCSRSCPPERGSDTRRAPARRPCPYMVGDSTQARGGFGDRLPEGEGVLAIARRVPEKERTFVGDHFWARGDAVSMVGFELEGVKKYIREQEQADKDASNAPFEGASLSKPPAYGRYPDSSPPRRLRVAERESRGCPAPAPSGQCGVTTPTLPWSKSARAPSAVGSYKSSHLYRCLPSHRMALQLSNDPLG